MPIVRWGMYKQTNKPSPYSVFIYLFTFLLSGWFLMPSRPSSSAAVDCFLQFIYSGHYKKKIVPFLQEDPSCIHSLSPPPTPVSSQEPCGVD